MMVQKLSSMILLLFLYHNGTEAKRTQACEGDSASLSCDVGVIKVTKANYGRTDGTTCISGRPANQISNTNCYRGTSLLTMSARCDGSKTCAVPAVNSVFSDPCVGTYKYLDVSYDCITAKRTVTCEGSLSVIACDEGFIKVTKANYGRTDGTTCTSGRPSNQISNTNCYRGTSLLTMSARCDGGKTCTVPAMNSIFSDPCDGTYKYLDVTHDCIPAKRSVTCEGTKSVIVCDTGVISVHHANYGRRDLVTCPHQYATPPYCNFPQTNRLRSWCNGKKSCEVTSSNSVFSDPCQGVYKYLEVMYSCV